MTEHKNLAAALAAFQAEMPTIHKGKKANVGQYSYTYADLADIVKSVAPLLASHGLAYAGSARMAEGGRYEIVGILSHASGETREGALPLNPGSSPQQMGSAITYMRRYLFGLLTGIVTDDDDDGRAAEQGHQASRQQSQRQAAKRQTRQQPAAPPPQQDTGEAIADKTRGRLFSLLGEAPGLAGDDDMQRQFLTDTLGRVVESRSSLTEVEGRRAIGRLEAWARGEAGAEWSPFEGDA